jgi:hypothetical protein
MEYYPTVTQGNKGGGMKINISTENGIKEVELLETLQIENTKVFMHLNKSGFYVISEWSSGYAIAAYFTIRGAKDLALIKLHEAGPDKIVRAMENVIGQTGVINV